MATFKKFALQHQQTLKMCNLNSTQTICAKNYVLTANK